MVETKDKSTKRLIQCYLWYINLMFYWFLVQMKSLEFAFEINWPLSNKKHKYWQKMVGSYPNCPKCFHRQCWSQIGFYFCFVSFSFVWKTLVIHGMIWYFFFFVLSINHRKAVYIYKWKIMLNKKNCETA